VVVAVPAVWMMQVPVDDEVDVVAVRNGGMAAACAMRVLSIVPSAGVARRASSGVHRVHLKGALVSVPVMGVMQVAVVSIVQVGTVSNGQVAAAAAVNVRVRGMSLMSHFTAPP